MKGLIVPKNSTRTSSTSIARNASIMYLELKEILIPVPSNLDVFTFSFTVPISGDVDDNSTVLSVADNLITLFPPSRANNDARSMAWKKSPLLIESAVSEISGIISMYLDNFLQANEK